MRKIFPILATVVAIGVIVKIQTPNDSFADFLKNHPYNLSSDLGEWEQIPKKDRPDLAMQQNFLMTVDPETRTVPVERLVKAFKEKKTYLSGRSSASIPGITWTERGPNNVGGRTRALMWDPNDVNTQKLWAAGVAGGIWFNPNITDANSSWQNVDDFMANLAVSTLAFDPTNTQEFYAGTGEGYFNGDAVRGAGIFKSTDGGNTWSQLNSTANSTFNYVQRIVVTDSGTILASSRGGGVQRSTDGGETWTGVLDSNSEGAFNSDGNDLEIAANGDIYATLGIFSIGSIHRSSDDGLTWESITTSGTNQERIELAVAPSASSDASTTVIYAVASRNSDIAWFRKSEDGGSTWTDLTIPKYRAQDCSESENDFTRSQAWYDLAIAVGPADENVVVAGGINVVRSGDGGVSMNEVSYWTFPGNSCDPYVHADIHNIVFRPGKPEQAVISSDGGVSFSANLGTATSPTFADRNKDYNVTQFYAVAAQNTADVNYYLAGSQDNGTQRFRDSDGLSTSEVTGGDGAFCFIDQDNPAFQISSYVYNNYYLLNSSGGFVTTLASSDAGRFINPADYDNSADILYSAGNQGELLRISGISDTPSGQETLPLTINMELISAINADALQDNRVFIGTGSGGVYRVDDAADTPSVTPISDDISTEGYVSSIALGQTDDEILVTFSNYGVNSVWYTNDGGSTWENKDNSTLPDIPVRWALFNPKSPQEVLLATELGVWSTSNLYESNPVWGSASTNLANVRCDMLQVRSSDNRVVVATHGRGVFTTNVFDVLATPSDLSIEQIDDSISLNWVDNASSEENYVVERSIGDDQSFELLATLDPNTVSFEESVPATNTMVYYKIYATSLLRGDSRVIEANILTLPEVPTIEETTNITSSEFTLNWSVTDEVNQFVIDVSEDSEFSTFLGGFQSRIVVGTNITISERPSGTYYFRLASRNTKGNSAYTETEMVVLDPLSVDKSEIIIFPNPANKEFSIQGVSESSSLSLFNMMGQKVPYNQSKSGNTIQVDISSLGEGIYFLKLQDGANKITKTIIKQ
ncbi:T9SS type A sorting domain-containing protein [Ekhidna sp.]|uniref:T9SS type A sorting domain-containing protein n=1 Tax=Ekhidna sp. TaxID=2608089 RepID=UPI003B511DB6